ncbi:sugar transferase [bacterium]|nr:sugar transferase [bacterium]
MWQISADRSIPIHQNLDYDIYYLFNRSMTLDMLLLWRTLWVAIKGI